MYGHCTDRAIIQTGSTGSPTADAITTIPSLFPHAEMLLTINDSTPICTTFWKIIITYFNKRYEMSNKEYEVRKTYLILSSI